MYTEILLPAFNGTYRMTVSVPAGQVVSCYLGALLPWECGTMMTLHDRDEVLMSENVDGYLEERLEDAAP